MDCSVCRCVFQENRSAMSPVFKPIKTLDDYPMEQSCSDAVSLYQKLQDQHQQTMKDIAFQEEEFKEMVAHSKQKFESTLQEKRRLRFVSASHDELYPPHDHSSLELGKDHTITSPQSHRENLGFFQQPVFRPPWSYGQKTIFNPCQASFHAQDRICKHINQISPQYRVVCTSHHDVCALLWDSRDYVAAGPNLLLVPLQELCIEDVTEGEIEQQPTTEIAAESNHTMVERTSLPDDNVGTTDDSEVSAEDESEQVERHCWVDDATVSDSMMTKSATHDDVSVSSSHHTKQAAQDYEDGSVEKFDTTGALKENRMKSIKSLVPAQRKSSSVGGESKEVGFERTVRGKSKQVDQVQEQRMPSVAPLEMLFPEPEDEPEMIQEPEPEPEPVVPGLICPSSVIRSRRAEIQIWLKSCSFSAANKNIPFTL